MATTNEARPRACMSCGAQTIEDNQLTRVSASMCPECGCILDNSDVASEERGFLTRLSRFGLGLKHRPLFRDHREEGSK